MPRMIISLSFFLYDIIRDILEAVLRCGSKLIERMATSSNG